MPNDHVSDPFEALAQPAVSIPPRPEFAAALRAQLEAELDLPTLSFPRPEPVRSTRMTTTTTTTTTTSPAPTTTLATAHVVVPYLSVHDGVAALDWYAEALGATVTQRVADADGKIAHAEFSIGAARFYLADEFPEIGVVSPRALGGTAVAIHLTLDDVDGAYDRAVAAGATSLNEPADQPHGARHGTLLDPFGHRWMLSQQVRTVAADDYATQMAEYGYAVTTADPADPGEPGDVAAAPAAAGNGTVWSAVNAADAPAMIRFMVETLGFDERLVVPGADPSIIEHSQLRWPDGGTVQVGSAGRPGPFAGKPVGASSLYLITADPRPVYDRCVAAGVTVLMPPAAPDYDPGGVVFTVEDAEGNLWSVGTYAGEP